MLADYRLPGFTAMDAWQHVGGKAGRPPALHLAAVWSDWRGRCVDAMRLGLATTCSRTTSRACRMCCSARWKCMRREARTRAGGGSRAGESEQRLAETWPNTCKHRLRPSARRLREIHDDIGGALAAVKFDLAWMGRHARG